MSSDLEKFKKFDAKLEWPARILFTIALIYCGLNITVCMEPSAFPEICFGLTIIAIWCFFYKIRIVVIGISLMLLVLAYARHGLLD